MTTDLQQSQIIAEDLPDHAGQLTQYQHLGLSRGEAFDLEMRAARIISGQRRAILEVGRELTAARDVAKYGSWGPFLARCGIEERTAQNLMNVFKRFGEQPEIISALSPTSLYRLAAPGADPDVVESIVGDVLQGARPSVAEVAARLTPPATPTPAPTVPMFSDEELAVATPATPAPAPTPPAPAPKAAAAPPPTPAAPPALPMPAASLPPPLLTPLTPASTAAPTGETRKVLAAKRALLDAALALVEEQLEQAPGPTVVVLHERALDAARMFLVSPALNAAAAMLAFSAVEEAAA